MIKNFSPSLAERGKIKIGIKGKMITSGKGKDFQQPKKLDHFRIVTLQRGEDGNYLLDQEVHKLYGTTPKELRVRLLYDNIELNFPTRYACFDGMKMWCSGNGEKALRGDKEVSCPCERLDPVYAGRGKCKINGCLNVIIEGSERVGGVWKFRTTGWNSTTGILSSLHLIKSITGGPIAGIPLMMSVGPKTVISPTDSKVQTVYVVTLEYIGGFEKLRELGYEIAKNRVTHNIRMENIEQEARKMIAHEPEIMDEDVVPEFYPDQINGNVKSEEKEADIYTSEFDKLVSWKIDYPPDATMDRFLAETAKANEVTVDQLKVEAAKSFELFWKSFEAWRQKTYPEQKKEKKERKTKQPPAQTEKAEPETNAASFRERVLAAGYTETELIAFVGQRGEAIGMTAQEVEADAIGSDESMTEFLSDMKIWKKFYTDEKNTSNKP